MTTYFFWRRIKTIYPGKKFRGYDIVFLTLILALVFGRASGIVANWEMYVRTGFSDILAIWDLNFDYLLAALMPLIAFQFFVLSFERKADWRKWAGWFVLFGVIFVLPVIAAQLARAFMFGWSQSTIVFHLLQLIWGSFVGIIIYFSLVKQPKLLSWLTVPMMPVLVLLGWGVVDVIVPGVLPERQLVTGIAFGTGALLIALVPFIQVLEKPAVRQVRQVNVRK